jgi:hypothetical protein
MEEFQDTLSRCAKLEVRKRAAKLREARMISRHEHERKQLQLAQDTMYKVSTYSFILLCIIVHRILFIDDV